MDSLVVETSKGKIRGFVDRSILGDEYLAFKGIPFAKPPVGQLRFQVSIIIYCDELGTAEDSWSEHCVLVCASDGKECLYII